MFAFIMQLNLFNFCEKLTMLIVIEMNELKFAQMPGITSVPLAFNAFTLSNIYRSVPVFLD